MHLIGFYDDSQPATKVCSLPSAAVSGHQTPLLSLLLLLLLLLLTTLRTTTERRMGVAPPNRTERV